MRLLGLNIKFRGRSDPPTKRFALNPFNDDYYSPVTIEKWKTQAGVTVDAELAMSYSAVYGCVKIISETIASLPLFTYKRLSDGGKKPYPQNPWFKILKTTPNKVWTASAFRETLTAHYLLHGNAYALIEYTKDGTGMALHILDPRKVTPEYGEDNEVYYRYRKNPTEPDVILPFFEVFHLQGFSDGGLLGKSVLTFMNEAIGLGKATELFGSTFYNNAAAPAGVLELGPEMDLSDEARERLKREWARKYGGVANAGSVAILEEGVSWKQIGIPAQDAQFLETRKFQIQDIARFFRVPPHMLADLDRATFSNIEHQSISFISQTMLTHFVRWEQTIARDLFRGDDRFFAEFLVAGLLRGDLASRYNAYAIGRQWGWLSVNDVRELENLNPLGDEGDVYLAPMNMVDAKKFGEVNTPNDPANPADQTNPGGVPSGPGSNDTPQENSHTLLKVLTRNISKNVRNAPLSWPNPLWTSSAAALSEIVVRVLYREDKFLGRYAERSQEEIDKFYSQQKEYAEGQLRSFVASQFESNRVAQEARGQNVRQGDLKPIVDEHVKEIVEVIVAPKITDWRSKIEQFANQVSHSAIIQIGELVLRQNEEVTEKSLSLGEG